MFLFLQTPAISHGVPSRIRSKFKAYEKKKLDWHISIKELMTVFLALQLLVPNKGNGHIQLSLDNTTAVAHLNHQGGGGGGIKSVQLSALATEMWHWCLERNILFSAVHVPESKNLFAYPPSHL